MSEEEIIRVEYEAIKRVCQQNKPLARRIASELGALMREFVVGRHPKPVTCDELCSLLQNATRHWA